MAWRATRRDLLQRAHNTMDNETRQLLDRIASVKPANEAEVETKILLHIFRLLGYTDNDRADKPTVTMSFGHEQKQKQADFIIYNGSDRTLANALIAAEAKTIGEPLEDAEPQAKSYALWAGTVFYVACNGEELLVAQFIPGGGEQPRTLRFPVRAILRHWAELEQLLTRREVVVAKERLGYLACYLPEIENLPPSEFFREYLTQLQRRFSGMRLTDEALTPPSPDEMVLPKIPVTARIIDSDEHTEVRDRDISFLLANPGTRLFIEGPPGSGKSTLCRRVTAELADQAVEPNAHLLPILVSLSRGIPDSLCDALQEACREMGVRVFPNLYRESMHKSHVVLILDGLDEVHYEGDYPHALDKLITERQNHSILITARPLSTQQSERLIAHYGFAYGHIRELTDGELRSVLESYLPDREQVESVFSQPATDVMLSLRSPLIALMVIRIAATQPDWASLSRFSLYESYVGVLHTFFASTPRGRATPVSLEEALSALSSAAVMTRTEGTGSPGIPLQALLERLKHVCRDEALSALLNTGLISSVGGKVTFVHQSFADFGIAWAMLRHLRERDPVSFSLAGASPLTYEFVHSALTPSDEATLREWLWHRDKKVRRRATGVLRYSRVAQTIKTIGQRLRQEGSLHVWSVMMWTLVARADPDFPIWISKHSERLSRRKLRKLAFAIRESGTTGFLPVVLDLAERTQLHALVNAAFALALRCDMPEVADRLLELFRRSRKVKQRIALCGIIRRYPNSQLGELLASRLLAKEKSPRVIVRLLTLLPPHLPGVPDDVLTDLRDRLLTRTKLLSCDREKLRHLAKRLSGASNKGRLSDLVRIYKRLGRRV